MLGLEARDSDDAFDPSPRPAISQHEEFMTPPFTPSRWSGDSPQAYSGVSVSQKLDRVLLMFEDMKRQIERDSVETKEQLSIFQDDLTDVKEKHRASVPKAKKKIPCDVSVRV